MAEVAWFFDELFIPRRLDFTGIAVIPLVIRDGSIHAAIAAYVAQGGPVVELSDASLPVVDVAGVVFHGVNATDPDQAVAVTSNQAHALASAVAFRQMGRGRLLAVQVQLEDNTVVRAARAPYSRVANLPFVPEEEEVAAAVRAFVDHPQAIVLADLFAEACRDDNPSAGVARLWTVLEAVAERLRGRKYDKVVAALGLLEVAEPEFGGGGLLRCAYDVRNAFMHEGRVAPVNVAARLRDDLAHLVLFILRRAGMSPIAPPAAGRS